MALGSRLTNAASAAPLPTATSFTSIGSRNDEVVFPQPYASTLAAARTVMVQSICPLRVVDHGLLLADAVAYRLVLDALSHEGPADPARLNSLTCLGLTFPGIDIGAATGFARPLVALARGLLDRSTWATSEPSLPRYATPYGQAAR
ncbi:hypothetical protein [Kribbella sp. DT2]|uniref:hypothetical protein n=1 Tax=Kribbella sp. DT2 TaxID=3393427 RepID=UPI003CE96F34